eukprot:CAMPEP_0117484764 /NCGR_PEP_ID=MMETSP0784-20121206/14622_1 /TAXON_ID=39447 /ORGANISM="" /LENGTH=95 /DNA_ID=CAMNT_0005279339 /DNA_START=75 /DNA_END=363 /DNA_ORIENTATION=-
MAYTPARRKIDAGLQSNARAGASGQAHQHGVHTGSAKDRRWAESLGKRSRPCIRELLALRLRQRAEPQVLLVHAIPLDKRDKTLKLGFVFSVASL